MSFFSTLGGVMNSIPVVGHVKGAVHYIAGDTEAGTAAMHSATRTAAVIGGGVVGAVAGPGGAVAGAIGAGAAVDGIVTGYDSLIGEEYRPHGQLETWTNVFTGNNIGANLADAAITTALDGLGGYGASGIGKSLAREGGKAAMKTTGREAAKQMLKQELKTVALQGAVAVNAIRAQKKETRRLQRLKFEERMTKSEIIFITTRMSQQQQNQSQQEEEQHEDKQQKRQKQEQHNSSNRNENNQSSSGDTTADGAGDGNSSDEQSDSGTETDLDDISSTDDSSADDWSDEESSCQAEKSDKTKCPKKAIRNGACGRYKHQQDVLRSKGLLPPLLRYTPFQIPSLDDIKAENCPSIQDIINSTLQNGSYGDPGYIYLFELENYPIIKIGRTHRLPKKRMAEQYKDMIKIGKKSWLCPSVKLAEYLIHKYLNHCRLLDTETLRQVELFQVDRERAIRVVEEIIKAIKESMKKGDDEGSGSE